MKEQRAAAGILKFIISLSVLVSHSSQGRVVARFSWNMMVDGTDNRRFVQRYEGDPGLILFCVRWGFGG